MEGFVTISSIKINNAAARLTGDELPVGYHSEQMCVIYKDGVCQDPDCANCKYALNDHELLRAAAVDSGLDYKTFDHNHTLTTQVTTEDGSMLSLKHGTKSFQNGSGIKLDVFHKSPRGI